jgi:hypothetical protein
LGGSPPTACEASFTGSSEDIFEKKKQNHRLLLFLSILRGGMRSALRMWGAAYAPLFIYATLYK